ncbi:hypothetical protein AB4Y89_00565 [Terriglobus sp. 2YAB30_2]
MAAPRSASSGSGSTLLVVDLNKDGVADIVTGNKLGAFIYLPG